MKNSYKSAIEYIRKYNSKSIFYKYLKKLFLMIGLPVILLIFSIYIYHQRAVNNEIQITAGTIFEKSVVSVENVFAESQNSASMLDGDPKISLFINSSEEQHIKDTMYYNKHVFEQLSRMAGASVSFDNIYAYSITNGHVMSSNGIGGTMERFPDKSWYGYFEKTGEANYAVCANDFYGKEKNLYIVFGTYDLGGLNGLMVYEVKKNTLDKLFYTPYAGTGSTFYLVNNKTGEILYGPAENGALPENVTLAVEKIKKNESGLYRKNDIIYFYRDIKSHSDLSLIYVNDLKSANKTLENLYLLFILCVAIAAMMPIFISIYISADFYKSVIKIVSELSSDDMADVAEVDEITFINNHIMAIIKKNEDIEQELVQRTAAFRQAQAMALQSQINPHFLFNTLNLISLSARNLLKGNNIVSKTVSLLAELLSYVLDAPNNTVSVREEIDYAKKYIEIQNIRHNYSFECLWNVEEDVLECKTIKMILQPVIENSFQHGLAMMNMNNRSGVISISVKENGGTILFCVSDNGGRIPEDTMAEIKERLKTNDLPQKGHIGLVNINQRIKLVYGEEYGVKIESDDSGTRTYIEFPTE